MKVAGEQKNREKFELLSSIKSLSGLSERRLWKIADCLDEELFEPGYRIIKQGTVGDAFFIVRSGKSYFVISSPC